MVNKKDLKFFRGVIKNGRKEGFCQVIFENDTVFKGFYKKD